MCSVHTEVYLSFDKTKFAMDLLNAHFCRGWGNFPNQISVSGVRCSYRSFFKFDKIRFMMDLLISVEVGEIY